MKRVLSVSLIILSLVFIFAQIENDFDILSVDMWLNKKEIGKFKKSFKKFERIIRSLEDTDESEDSNEPEDSSIEDISMNDTYTEDIESSSPGTSIPSSPSTSPDATIPAPPTVDITTPIIEPQPINTGIRYATINVLSFQCFRVNTNPHPSTPAKVHLIQFVVFIRYINISPFYRVTFTLKFVYNVYTSRGLEEGEIKGEKEENTTTICTYTGERDPETGVCIYNCDAEAEGDPFKSESYNDMKFYDRNGNPIDVPIGDINFSPEAEMAAKNLTLQVSNINHMVTFDNAEIYNSNSSLFYIKGQLNGGKKDVIAQQNKITFTFNDKLTDTKKNVTCDVVKHDTEDFHIRCEPLVNITGSIFQSNGSVDDIAISVNSTPPDDVNIVKYNQYSNIKWRKNSSGLSGGAIAGIVIACAIALILITILAMLWRRRKVIQTNNSTIVGLQTSENQQEKKVDFNF